jgi:integration host factor subunit alpha
MSGDTVTRSALVEALRREVGLSRDECANLLNQALDEIADHLAEGETVKLSNFGVFLVRHKRGRIGRNVQTGEEVPVSARNVVVFRPSEALKRRCNR